MAKSRDNVVDVLKAYEIQGRHTENNFINTYLNSVQLKLISLTRTWIPRPSCAPAH